MVFFENLFINTLLSKLMAKIITVKISAAA